MKVVIIGGGTAGWLTAAQFELLNTSDKERAGNLSFDVTVVESENIPIIGAGEGSTGILFDTLNNQLKVIGADHLDFLYETDATMKMGINFKDWNGKGTQFYSPLQPSQTATQSTDWDLLAFKVHSKPHLVSMVGNLMERGLSTYDIQSKYTIGLSSYHFDAHKVGNYFKKLCTNRKTKHITADVVKVNKNSETGFVESVELADGRIIEADFWIDCSGFKRVLANEMNCGWYSYSNHLPVNNALPYLHKYKDDEDVRGETLAWAQPNGWMWQIPTQQRYGCGYVYSDMFTNADNALKELEENTGRIIEPIRNLKFDVGRLQNFWDKNVVAIGLSSGFLEPLQATSIHTTIVQINMLLNVLDVKDNMEYVHNAWYYNNFIRKLYDDNRDLIQIHYMNKRDDSEFWRFCQNELPKTDKVKYITEISKYRSPGFLDFPMEYGSSSWGVWCWTVMGLDIVTAETAYKTLRKYSYELYANKVVIDYNENIGSLKEFPFMKNSDLIKEIRNKTLPKQNVQI